jgi:hypothetical protein
VEQDAAVSEAVPEAEDSPLRLTTRDLFAALPAVSALAVGALYALGVFMTVTQLVGAHVPAPQALPLIPLQDHLAKGLGAVFTSPAVFIGAAGAFITLLWGYASSRSFARREGESNAALDRLRALTAAFKADPLWEERERLAADFETFQREFKEAGLETAPEDDPRVAAFESRKDELAARTAALAENVKRAEHRLQETNEQIDLFESHSSSLQRSNDRMRAAPRCFERVAPFTASACFVFALFFPVDLILLPVLLGLLLLSASRVVPHYPVLGGALLVSVTLVPLIVAGYVNPTPLPAASITTDRGTTRGGLITASGDRYVVTQSRDSYVSIPASEVRSVEVKKRKRERKQSIFQLVT